MLRIGALFSLFTMACLWPAAGTPAAGSAQSNWEIDAAGLAGSCAMVTPVIVINDGFGETKVQVKLNRERLEVFTDSNIDNSRQDLGLRVDDEPFIGISGLAGNMHVVFGKENIGTIIDQFLPGKRVVFYLRFWPTWPETGIKEAEFSLIGFTRTLQSLSECT
jgi:hypothetical protein